MGLFSKFNQEKVPAANFNSSETYAMTSNAVAAEALLGLVIGDAERLKGSQAAPAKAMQNLQNLQRMFISIADFAKGAKEQPETLTRSEAQAFTHEFTSAMHADFMKRAEETLGALPADAFAHVRREDLRNRIDSAMQSLASFNEKYAAQLATIPVKQPQLGR